eukprot:6913792-Pyramimonas_sp.AAC.1
MSSSHHRRHRRPSYHSRHAPDAVAAPQGTLPMAPVAEPAWRHHPHFGMMSACGQQIRGGRAFEKIVSLFWRIAGWRPPD